MSAMGMAPSSVTTSVSPAKHPTGPTASEMNFSEKKNASSDGMTSKLSVVVMVRLHQPLENGLY